MVGICMKHNLFASTKKNWDSAAKLSLNIHVHVWIIRRCLVATGGIMKASTC